MVYTPDNITELASNQCFVYGSNEAGIDGAGAALVAHQVFRRPLKMGWGYYCGKAGCTFAIPTKDRHIQTLPLDKIEKYVREFIGWAAATPEMYYLVTKIGCGLAGYSPEDIAPMFKDSTPNVILPKEFVNIINKQNVPNN